MSSYNDTTLEEVPLPPAYKPNTSYSWTIEHDVRDLPSAYTANISYGAASDNEDDPDMYYQTKDSKRGSFRLAMDQESLRSNHAEVTRSKSLMPAYILVLLSKSRYYIRALAILVMILSMVLILTGVAKFSNAKKNPQYKDISKPAPITDQPCIVFSGIAAMNLVLSAALLLTSCFSSKFRKSNTFISAAFTIISAIGFSSSMGACFFLNKKTTLENDLWKWSCAHEKDGTPNTALNFGEVCNVIAFSWRFGLVQAGLELLTFLICLTIFIVGRCVHLTPYGIY